MSDQSRVQLFSELENALEQSDAEHKCKVLIVDDMPEVRLMLAAMLRAVDSVEVVGQASDGVEAVEVANKLLPDVIILDIAMPRKTGLEIMPDLTALPTSPRVVIHSGFDSIVREEALASGAHSFLAKGARMDEILGAVKGACVDCEGSSGA